MLGHVSQENVGMTAYSFVVGKRVDAKANLFKEVLCRTNVTVISEIGRVEITIFVNAKKGRHCLFDVAKEEDVKAY